MDKALLPFILADAQPSDSNPYFQPRSEPSENTALESNSISPSETQSIFFGPGTSRLIFHLDRLTGMCRLYIPPSVVPELLAIAHGEGHPGFSRYHEIIFRSWFIRGLTKVLQSFIRHCPQCLAFQTRKHVPYGSL